MKAITILLGAPVPALALALALAGCGGGSGGESASMPNGEENGASAQAKPTVAVTPMPQEPTPKPPVWVLLDTSMGDIVIQLDPERAPITVDNFLSYVDEGFYDGTIFHRVLPTFVIQGGGFTPDMVKKQTKSPIPNEWRNGLKNDRGTISMARTRRADSATTQFFINVSDNRTLDTASPNTGGAAYAVFGKIVAGMAVVDKIRSVPTEMRKTRSNVPVSDVLIERAKRLEPKDAQRYIAAGQ